MISTCPKCGQDMPHDSVYCPYCGHGIKPTARTNQVSAAGTLMIVAAIASLVFLVLSLRALTQLYRWYPTEVANSWILYNQILTCFSFTGCLFGFLSGFLSLTRRHCEVSMSCAVLCTLSGAGAWTISLIIPFANAMYSLLFYFLPAFITALIGTLLVYSRRAEFR